MKQYWVVGVLRKWESLEVLGLPLQTTQDPDCIGFLPVFTTEKAARVWCTEHRHPKTLMIIQEVDVERA